MGHFHIWSEYSNLEPKTDSGLINRRQAQATKKNTFWKSSCRNTCKPGADLIRRTWDVPPPPPMLCSNFRCFTKVETGNNVRSRTNRVPRYARPSMDGYRPWCGLCRGSFEVKPDPNFQENWGWDIFGAQCSHLPKNTKLGAQTSQSLGGEKTQV